MNAHGTSSSFRAGAIALSAACLLSCEQPRMECVAAESGPIEGTNDFLAFATTYQRVRVLSGDDCPAAPPELVGFAVYHGRRDTTAGAVRDLSQRKVAVRSATMGTLGWQAEDAGLPVDSAALSSLGSFSARFPDEDGFCHVPALSPAVADYPAVTDAEGTVVFPATSLRYEWRDLQLYVTPAAPGTQFSATVVITSGACSVEYAAIGMWPAIDCGATDEAGNVTPDDTLCDPEPDPARNRTSGSGINPDFGPTGCDPTLFRCVLRTGEIPALGGYRGGAR
jgi:hypothetical protein